MRYLSKVSYLPTSLDVPIERVLDNESIRQCERVVVIGWDKEDKLYFASSTADIADVMLLLELAKQASLDQLRE